MVQFLEHWTDNIKVVGLVARNGIGFHLNSSILGLKEHAVSVYNSSENHAAFGRTNYLNLDV